ncbi:MAG: DUF3048 domain-containing protein [Nocardioides sp.]|uniref:DUF3048 domain-containing protein n=1 Tax=Nocardioides sp. TaxID=35761 RepID=UPI0039E43CA8
MRTTRPATRTLLRVVSPLAAIALALTACGGGSDDSDASSSSPQAVDSGASLDSTWPLTGLAVSGDESAAQSHPAYIVKVDNTEDSDPQIGLSQADMVTQELVEGGITRLAVFYYTNLPSKVGPVRSMRATDAGIAAPINATIITSGAAGYTFKQLKKQHVRWIAMGNHNVTRILDGTHDTLHSVFANVKSIGKEAKTKTARPEDYFTWGEASDYTGKKKASSIKAQFSGYRTDDFSYKGGKYVLANNYFASGDAFTPDTVITATVRTTIAPYTDPAGNPVPVSHFTGTGKAWIFHGGKALKATWKKAGEDATVKFYVKGKQVKIPTGHTWLDLIPKSGGNVSFTAK